MTTAILRDKSYMSPEATHTIKLQIARKAQGFTSLGNFQVTVFEANWKFQEICDRYPLCLHRSTIKACASMHYNEAKSIMGVVRKNERVTPKQWRKLVDISFMLFEIANPEGRHYCKFY